jgi:hypothetical protein
VVQYGSPSFVLSSILGNKKKEMETFSSNVCGNLQVCLAQQRLTSYKSTYFPPWDFSLFFFIRVIYHVLSFFQMYFPNKPIFPSVGVQFVRQMLQNNWVAPSEWHPVCIHHASDSLYKIALVNNAINNSSSLNYFDDMEKK